MKNQMLRPTAPTARPRQSPWGKRVAGDRLTSVGHALPPSDDPRRHSHPDCRSPLTLIVARQSCLKPSRVRSAPGETASSSSNSTMPAGTPRKIYPCLRASGSRLPAGLDPGTATGRTPLAAHRRASRQRSLRNHRRSRGRRRQRCRQLHRDPITIASNTHFHWWPKTINPT